MEFLPAVEMCTAQAPDASIIWLHGLGASGHDFAPIVPELSLPPDLGIRFIFPHAPQMAVTVNGGYVMPAWYDIYDLDIDRRIDIDQLSASADLIDALVERERSAGIDSRRICIAGFSQGGAVAYEVALRYRDPLGGLLVMSSYFATRETIACSAANQGLPVVIHHGLYDPVVPESLGRQSRDELEARGYAVEYLTYPMEHGVCPQQLGDIAAWIRRALAQESSAS